MKRKTIALVALIVGTMLFACSCSSAGNAVSNTVAQFLKGTVKGQVEKTYGTQWFEFTVKSIEKVDSYAGYEPADGYELYAVLVNEKCTFDEPIPMGTYDFYMDADSFDDYIYPIDPLDDTMMPYDFELETDQEAEYYMIYEIPADTEGLLLCYTEIDDTNTEGTHFTIAIN